jgi:hypothetical protein
VRGSHKLNLPVPDNVAHGLVEGFAEHLYQPVTQAGDVVIWSEATVHGATPWKADHQRRIALYRFSPANMGYGRGYLEIDPARLEGMIDAQRAVLQPPYASRLERPVLGSSGDGGVKVAANQSAMMRCDMWHAGWGSAAQRGEEAAWYGVVWYKLLLSFEFFDGLICVL